MPVTKQSSTSTKLIRDSCGNQGITDIVELQSLFQRLEMRVAANNSE
jgi:hypothetical protein